MVNLNKLKKVTAFILSAVLIMSSSECLANAVTDAQDEYDSISEQIEDNEAEIEAIRDEVEVYVDEIESLDLQIDEYTNELNELQAQVDAINEQIEKYQSELQNTAQLYNSAEDVYVTRLRAIYENGIPSVFEILISSDGISDFFSRLNVYSSVLEYDQNLIGNMETQKEYVGSIKSNIEEAKLLLEQLTYDVEKSTNELEAAKAQKESVVSTLESSEAALLAATAILQEEKEEAEAKLQEEMAKAAAALTAAGTTTSTQYFSGIFVWPTTSTIITANFGWYSPYGYSIWHSGTDIGVSTGSSVYAAASGTVLIANYVTSNPNDHSVSGYGNYIMIDHGTDSNGDRLYTLYGHLSAVNVSVGQTVTQGQIIGYSGNTGNSTGAHLHFEVRVNGTAVNAMSYFY